MPRGRRIWRYRISSTVSKKSLILWRHAKSSWGDPARHDHDRPLSERGRAAAPVMANWINEHLPAPDLILSSTSARTKETVKPFLALVSADPVLAFERGLYLANEAALAKRIAAIPSGIGCAMIVGHNPGMENVCDRLTARVGADAENANRRRLDKYPTAAVAHLTSTASTWREAAEAGFTLENFVVPRDLMEARS